MCIIIRTGRWIIRTGRWCLFRQICQDCFDHGWKFEVVHNTMILDKHQWYGAGEKMVAAQNGEDRLKPWTTQIEKYRSCNLECNIAPVVHFSCVPTCQLSIKEIACSCHPTPVMMRKLNTTILFKSSNVSAQISCLAWCAARKLCLLCRSAPIASFEIQQQKFQFNKIPSTNLILIQYFIHAHILLDRLGSLCTQRSKRCPQTKLQDSVDFQIHYLTSRDTIILRIQYNVRQHAGHWGWLGSGKHFSSLF